MTQRTNNPSNQHSANTNYTRIYRWDRTCHAITITTRQWNDRASRKQEKSLQTINSKHAIGNSKSTQQEYRDYDTTVQQPTTINTNTPAHALPLSSHISLAAYVFEVPVSVNARESDEKPKRTTGGKEDELLTHITLHTTRKAHWLD